MVLIVGAAIIAATRSAIGSFTPSNRRAETTRSSRFTKRRSDAPAVTNGWSIT